MKLIRRVAAAFTLWALATCVWAALSHLTSLPGPAQVSTATLEGVARLLERADPPGALGAPQRLAAAQLRRTAHAAGRINGSIEHAIGEWVDRLGHDAAHRRDFRFESGALVTEPTTDVTVTGTGHRRFTIRVDARSGRVRARPLSELRAPHMAPRNRPAGVWIDRTVEAPAGSSEPDLKLRVLRHGDTFSLKAAEAGSALDEAPIHLEVDANFDRKKLKERIEKLLDLLEDLQNVEGGR